MQGTTVSIDDVQIKYPVREYQPSIEGLKRSIRRLGLQVPPIVNPASFEVISGERRIRAYREVRPSSTVRVLFPVDVVEACQEMGDHVIDPVSQECALPMSPREKVNLASRLAELPAPSGVPKRSFSHLPHVAKAIGFSAKVLHCFNLAIERSREGELNLMPDAVRARESLDIMLRIIVEGLDCRETDNRVQHIFKQSMGSSNSAEEIAVAAPKSLRRSMHPGHRKGRLEEFKRGLSQVSGGVEGLLIGIPSGITESDLVFIEREIKTTRKFLSVLLKEVESVRG